jgi:biopolymer transport protein ExbB
MWVLLGMSVLAVAVGIERLIVQWGFLDQARALAETVSRCLSRGALDEGRSACERSRSPLADVYLVGYERFGRARRIVVHGAVNRERVRVATSLKSNMWVLGTIGATAPFVGLFGTVIGILAAFGKIAEAGGGGLDVVSAEIKVALYATAFGIMVAVVAVGIYNYFNQRLARVAGELRMMTEEFLELLDEHDPKARDALDVGDDADPDRPDPNDPSDTDTDKKGKRHGARDAA